MNCKYNETTQNECPYCQSGKVSLLDKVEQVFRCDTGHVWQIIDGRPLRLTPMSKNESISTIKAVYQTLFPKDYTKFEEEYNGKNFFEHAIEMGLFTLVWDEENSHPMNETTGNETSQDSLYTHFLKDISKCPVCNETPVLLIDETTLVYECIDEHRWRLYGDTLIIMRKNMSTEEYKAMDRRVVNEIINQGKYEIAEELFAPEYLYHGPGGQELKGPEGFVQLITIYRTAFPDIHLTIKDMIAEGDRLVVRFTSTGTHSGDLMGIPPTGKKISITGIIIYRIANGKFVESWEVLEQMTMMQQLGVIPTP